MSRKQKPRSTAKPPPPSPTPGGPGEGVPTGIVRRTIAEVLLGASNRVMTLIAVGLLAFASVFLMVGWQYGPLVMLQAQQYRKFTSSVDATIVESWLALEFDENSVRQPSHWRASTNASRCVVAEYGGDWGAPLRRAYCGTRVPFNESYLLADLSDISPGVPFVWGHDERGWAVPEIRVAPSTKAWLATHAPNKFMHDRWPANTALEWLRLELDRPVDAAVAGWTSPSPILPIAFDPDRPDEGLPKGIVDKRLQQRPNWVAMIVGFGAGLLVWFKAMALLPVLSGMPPRRRLIWSALPLLTLPWWMDAFPHQVTRFSGDIGGVLADMFSDIAKTDRLIATGREQAMLANGERLVWRLDQSVYADTIGQFRFAAPNPSPASEKAALAALTEAITTQARALDDDKRAELFTRLDRDKRIDLTRVSAVFERAAREAADDPAVGPATRRAAKRFLD